jgi:GLPGLI family protein
MKFIKLCVVFVLISLNLCESQNSGQALYLKTPSQSFKSGIDSLNKSDPNSPLKGINESVSNLEFLLRFDSQFALYEKNEKMSSDLDNSTSTKLAMILSGFLGPSYFDFKNRIILNKREFMGNHYLVHKSFSSIDWALTKEKFVLNNLTCYKATTTVIREGRSGIKKVNITAWYTLDINIPAGPDGYGGLPGLIIQIQDDKFVTTLKKVVFDNSATNIELPTKGIQISEKDFNKLVKEMTSKRYGSRNKN